MDYDLDIDGIITRIKERDYKRILLQLPDGLKSSLKDIIDPIEQQTGAEVITWFGTNFGACDIPQNLKTLQIDMVVAFGHNVYLKDPEGW
ncbi:hypothetical protein H6504_05690 [Candidatus Woesearchaeota archaeon]|nr:hypothetical protein [Candidatus Woesearchaeota archaeon]